MEDVQPEDYTMHEMDEGSIEEVLNGEQIGTLSLSEDGDPYGIPMSFGYRDGSIYFEFGGLEGETGHKFEIIQDNPQACLTVYTVDDSRWNDSTANLLSTGFSWASVMVKGRLERFEDMGFEQREAIQEARTPSPANPWGGSLAETEFDVYRLEPDEMTGRVAGEKQDAVE